MKLETEAKVEVGEETGTKNLKQHDVSPMDDWLTTKISDAQFS